jgi:hypothetical protein
MEGKQSILPLHFVDTQLDFAEGGFFILAKISEREFNDATTNGVGRVLCWRGSLMYESREERLS